jgi:hypothetical protein
MSNKHAGNILLGALSAFLLLCAFTFTKSNDLPKLPKYKKEWALGKNTGGVIGSCSGSGGFGGTCSANCEPKYNCSCSSGFFSCSCSCTKTEKTLSDAGEKSNNSNEIVTISEAEYSIAKEFVTICGKANDKQSLQLLDGIIQLFALLEKKDYAGFRDLDLKLANEIYGSVPSSTKQAINKYLKQYNTAL